MFKTQQIITSQGILVEIIKIFKAWYQQTGFY